MESIPFEWLKNYTPALITHSLAYHYILLQLQFLNPSSYRMAQCTWTYVSDDGRKYNVSVFHGPNTGHLLVMCNLKILLIDFSVVQSKSYSFFLGEDLFVLDLDRQGNKFYYDFQIDFEVDTPINRRRKALAKKHWFQSLAFFGFLIACIFMFTSLVIKSKPDQSFSYAVDSPIDSAKVASAQVFLLQGGKALDIEYRFVVYDNIYYARTSLPDSILTNGMPLVSGDEFKVYFSKYNPQTSAIDFNQPSENQLKIYRERVAQKHANLNENVPSSMVSCLVETAYAFAGVKGLADLFHQDIPPEVNPEHNVNSYLRLIRDVDFNRQLNNTCY